MMPSFLVTHLLLNWITGDAPNFFLDEKTMPKFGGLPELL